MKTTQDERFWAKVHEAPAEECWVWRGKINGAGYGIFRADGKDVRAHRYAYTILVADIPEGLQIDHLCRTRACVNPWHMDPVTLAVNTARGNFVVASVAERRGRTHCAQGHPFDIANTRVMRKGYRACRQCARENMRAFRARRAA